MCEKVAVATRLMPAWMTSVIAFICMQRSVFYMRRVSPHRPMAPHTFTRVKLPDVAATVEPVANAVPYDAVRPLTTLLRRKGLEMPMNLAMKSRTTLMRNLPTLSGWKM